MKNKILYIILISLLGHFGLVGNIFAQKKSTKTPKKPVLTNKYRLQKKGEPFEGTKSTGLEKVQKAKKPKFGEFAGKDKRSNVPKNTQTSKFKGKEKLNPAELKTGNDKFISKEPYYPTEKQLGHDKFISKDAYYPTEKKLGHDKFISKYAYKPTEKKLGHDKFISKYAYKPTEKKLGHDKFISKYAYKPTEKKLGHDKFISKYAYKPTEKKLGHDKFTGNIIRYSQVANRKRNYAKAARKQQSYRGNLVYVDIKKIRARRDKRMQSYHGNIWIKKRPNHFRYHKKYTSRNIKNPYDARRMKKGKFFMTRRMIPRYQKIGSEKLRYNSRENNLWNSETAGGAITGGRKKLGKKDIKRIKKEKALQNPPINTKKDD